ncbi:hypothetical protein ES692_12215 [Psychroserpens burtonensis]|uniref:Selenophosphate synthetase n=2 Tax=Psychroserpens burtonensis TaxID=49278 RepID=A0A5C7B4R5_9FLAO|nr:hypothetical protein ES692_12215 [Psychroserpens burtonensis]
MTRFLTILCMISLLVSCKAETKEENTTPEMISEEQKELTVAEKIAQAYGIDNWKNVNEIQFTFNVDRGDSHFERSWTWSPKTDNVGLLSNEGDTNYNRKSLDSLSLDADRAFVNDKYWLLSPFQLVWDQGTTISKSTKETAPMSKTKLNKITITYSNEGGYTPGDAYDFYFDDEYLIKEWVFRKGNSVEPSMITSFENYSEFNGIKIAKDHVKSEGNWKLYFTDITIR